MTATLLPPADRRTTPQLCHKPSRLPAHTDPQGDCDKTNSDAAGLVASLGSAAGVLIWVTTGFVTLANVSEAPGSGRGGGTHMAGPD